MSKLCKCPPMTVRTGMGVIHGSRGALLNIKGAFGRGMIFLRKDARIKDEMTIISICILPSLFEINEY